LFAKIFSKKVIPFGVVGGLGCVGAKLNVVQSVGFVRLVAPLLILRRIAKRLCRKIVCLLVGTVDVSTVALRLQATSRVLAMGGIFCTKFDTKHECSNLAKSFIRSTSARLLPIRC